MHTDAFNTINNDWISASFAHTQHTHTHTSHSQLYFFIRTPIHFIHYSLTNHMEMFIFFYLFKKKNIIMFCKKNEFKSKKTDEHANILYKSRWKKALERCDCLALNTIFTNGFIVLLAHAHTRKVYTRAERHTYKLFLFR